MTLDENPYTQEPQLDYPEVQMFYARKESPKVQIESPKARKESQKSLEFPKELRRLSKLQIQKLKDKQLSGPKI